MKQTSDSLCSRLEVMLVWIKENAVFLKDKHNLESTDSELE